ncbi:MAG: sulfurtransferase TusA [Gammaproteobacteria bacterium]|nr:sulfurtransferase TusA [Gammaproteobacteria bacterium]
MEPPCTRCVDTSGLRCPEPVMMLHNALRKLAVGEVLKVIATDPTTERDIPRFCHYLGHELVKTSAEQGVYLYFIRRG